MKAASLLTICLIAPLPGAVAAAAPAELFFREDWKEIPAATPVTQDHVAHPQLELHLHGPGREGVRKSHHEHIPNDPFYIWSGLCEGTWAVSLRHRGGRVDLSAPEARIRWRAKQTGFRLLRVIVKQADGTWLVADQADDASAGWREREFIVADLRWRRLDIDHVVEGPWVASPDLSRIEQVGVTDLMRGGRTPASSRLDWIEVWGRPVR